MFWNKYPYTDFHELNLDMILQMIKELTHEVDTFKVINKITFYGDWDITRQYPAWSIVSNNGDGYISIKPVPAGVDIDNIEYWVIVANYSALYADMQNRIIKLEKNVGELQRWDNRTVLFVGDSYGTWGTPNDWADLCGSYLNCTYHNLAVGGTGFNIGGNGFLSQIQNYSGDRTLVTDIVVGGGINDAENRTLSGVSNLINAIQSFITYAKNNYPNARVHIGFIGGCQGTSLSFAASHTPEMVKLTQYCYTTCARFGAEYLNGVENVLHIQNVLYSADGLHP